MKLCLNCKKELIGMKDTAKYCCVLCKRRHHSRKSHGKNRDAQKEYFKKWYLNNRDKHIAVQKKYYKEHLELHYLRSFAYHHLRKKLLEKFNNKCSECSCCNNLELHHMSYERKDGLKVSHDVNNCVILCRNCHKKLHRKHI